MILPTGRGRRRPRPVRVSVNDQVKDFPVRWRTLLLCVLLCIASLATLGAMLYFMLLVAMSPLQLMLILLDLASRSDSSI